MSFYLGLEKLAQKGKSLSPLASITGISLFLIISMCLLFLWKKYQPYKGGLKLERKFTNCFICVLKSTLLCFFFSFGFSYKTEARRQVMHMFLQK